MVVGDDQDIDQALSELRHLVDQEHGRPWYKRRYGYYEKPSALRRKVKKMRQLRGAGPALFWPRGGKFPRSRASAPAQRHLDFPALFQRTGPTTSAGG